MSYPKVDPVLAGILSRKVLEIELLMMGIPKEELDTATDREIMVTLEILKFMRDKKDG